MLSSAFIKSKASELGFDLCGVSRADRFPRLTRLIQWIDSGYAGDMSYLSKSLDERLDPRRVLASARSVVSLGTVYNTRQPYSTAVDEPGRAAIARYAWGDDYHDVIRGRLRALLSSMAGIAGPGFEAWSCVDSGPVQERVFAEQAGLGWIGKNTCVINPKLGSWIFLSEILCSADLDPDIPAVDQCGTCTRCLDACPTGAIVEPYAVDATRCLSYLTIEARGAVDESLRSAINRQVVGCDICQDVCPWNRRAATSDDPAWQPRDGFAFPRLIDLCRWPDDEWRRRIRGSALAYTGLRQIRRSLAYAAASLPEPDRAAALDALAQAASSAEGPAAAAIAWAREE